MFKKIHLALNNFIIFNNTSFVCSPSIKKNYSLVISKNLRFVLFTYTSTLYTATV